MSLDEPYRTTEQWRELVRSAVVAGLYHANDEMPDVNEITEELLSGRAGYGQEAFVADVNEAGENDSDYLRGYRRGFDDAKLCYKEPFVLRALGPGLAAIATLLLFALCGALK